jgi:hypothetical protein
MQQNESPVSNLRRPKAGLRGENPSQRGLHVALRKDDKDILKEIAAEHGSPMTTVVGGAVRAFKRLSPTDRLPFIRESHP